VLPIWPFADLLVDLFTNYQMDPGRPVL